jgi:FAD dependent oxidoreductase TIGR03364
MTRLYKWVWRVGTTIRRPVTGLSQVVHPSSTCIQKVHSGSTIHADLCIVGAGIVGLAHAHEARARGLQVVVLERHARAVGASVRNFGHGFLAAMGDGEPLDCAIAARERWLELGVRAGLEVLQCGSVVVARHADELAVMDGVAQDERRGARMLTAREAGALAPIPTDRLLGALHATRDYRVDPRQAVSCLAQLLEGDEGARILWGAAVHAVQPGRVQSTRASVRAPLVVVCPGPDYRSLPPEVIPRRPGLTSCKLQMLRVAAPDRRRYRPVLLTGLSLLRYPGFTAMPGFGLVQARLEAERPELIAAGIHLIVAQLATGDLILGDTHEYGEPVSPFGREDLDRLVLAEACGLLGVPRLEVRERWHGVYPVAPGNPFLVSHPLPGVRVVEVVAGFGMTTALGLAPRVLDELLGSSPELLSGDRAS